MSLPDWLADPDLAPVWSTLYGPVSRGARTSRLRGLPREARHALGRVLGRPVVGDVTVTLVELSELLAARAGLSLAEVVVLATGRPLLSTADDRAERQEPLEVLGAEYADAVRGLSLTLDLARDAVRVLTAIGAPQLRTELAASCAGDAHALDEGRPLATLVLRCLAASYNVPAPRSTAERRELWERAGVLADAVSSTVLTLGLRPVAGDSRAVRLRTAADLGEVHLSAWDVRRTPLALDPGVPVLVCENPAVLEAFAVRRGGTQPVVCTAGWPAAVAVDLLDQLGAPLRYHGDLDWRGVEICGWLVARSGVVPWLMTADDYLAASGGAPLKGREVATPWEPGLAAAMRERGLAVYEEQVVQALLAAWLGA